MKYAVYNRMGVLELREDSCAELPVGAKFYTDEFKACVYAVPPPSDSATRAMFEALS